MDIHRCRFVQYPPQPINALAFSHSSDPKKKAPSDLRLALGRNNADIEIWNPQKGLWVQETILKGNKDTTVEQLVWTQELVVEAGDETTNASRYSRGPLRLFSTGGSTAVTEWNLCTGAPKRRVEANFGAIWCFAAQPQIQDNKVPDSLLSGAGSQWLAAGCSDGSIVLFSTEDDDLRFVRALAQPPVKKTRVLSLTWRDRNTVVAGYEDSMIRVIDVPSRRILRNMSLGKPVVEGNNSVVWTVKCLPDGTIISGDSSGELKIWDSQNLSLLQRLNSHRADILDIATSASGDTIFSVSLDRRTVTYKQVPIHSGTSRTRWAEVSHKRYHQHDVKCATTFESKELSVLVTGGMDSRPVIVPVRRSQSEYHRTLPHLPQRSQISASRSARLFISWWGREIVVHHVRKYENLSNDTESDIRAEPYYDTLARLDLQDDENIQDTQISEDGQFIVAATISSVKMFQLRKTHVSGKPCLRTRQIELPPSFARLGARRVGFSPDGKWLYCVRKDNAIALAKVMRSENAKERPSIHEKTIKLYRQSRNRPSSALGSYDQNINQITFSSDSRALAIGDLSGATDVWILEGHEDMTFIDESASDEPSSEASSSSSTSSDDEDDSSSPIVHGQKWIRNPSGSSLPQLDSSILALTFRPSSPSKAQTEFSTHDNLGLHPTRHNPHPVTHELPSATGTTLLAITATHNLVEFDVLASKLSDWSRRNPSRFLPHYFTRIKDRVVGTFWDCTNPARKGERLWLYGSTWIFMLDVSKDLQPQYVTKTDSTGLFHGLEDAEKIGQLGRYDVLEPAVNDEGRPSEKQKVLPASREPTKQQRRDRKRKRNTGAGDDIRLHERERGVGPLVRRFRDAESEDAVMIDIDAKLENEMDVDVEDEEEDDVLALMRREGNAESVATNQEQPTTATSSKPRRSWSHWHTFEYNSILGISVIGPSPPTADSSNLSTDGGQNIEMENQNENIEVIIVERPMHDVEQVPRFDGGQEWDV